MMPDSGDLRDPPITIAVLAHQEERRIAACLRSLPLGRADVVIHVAVNGSNDRTAAIARAIAAETSNLTVHDWVEGGKARSWNRLMLDTMPVIGAVHVMIDGDAVILPGSIDALVATLTAAPEANAAAGLPRNGRLAAHYQQTMTHEHGLFGDLYALRGSFLQRFRESGFRLPEDLIGDDSLIGALAKTDLGPLDQWTETRLLPCPDAGFLCEPVSLLRWHSWRIQYRRMINYSVRHFQNQIITARWQQGGPLTLPTRMASLYRDHAALLRPRASLSGRWFDRRALRRMEQQARMVSPT